jgi:hypothetical protein
MPFIPDDQPTTKRVGFVPDKKTWSGFGENIFNSGGKLIGDTVGAVANVFNPNMEKNTVANLARLGAGVLQLAIPGEQGNEKLAVAVGKFYADRYGGIDKALNSFYNDPVGVVADLSVVLGGTGALLKGAGAASKSANLARAGSTVSRAGSFIDPLSVVGRGASKFAKAGIRGVDDWSRKYATAGLTNPAAIRDADAILKRITTKSIDPVTGKQISRPMTIADLIAEGNLYGRSVDDVVSFSNNLSNQFDKIANNPNLLVKIENITKPLDDLIESTKQAIKDFPNEKSFKIQLKELTRQRKNLVSKARGGFIPADETLRMRRSLDSVTSDSASRGVQLKPGEMQAKQSVVSGLRSGLREADPKLTELGKKMQAIGFDSPGKKGPVLKAFESYESRAKTRNPITLTTISTSGTGAGVGALLGGPIGATGGVIGANVLKNVMSSPKGIEVVSKGGQLAARSTGTVGRNIARQTTRAYPAVKNVRMVTQTFGSEQSQSQPLPQQPIQLKDQSYKPIVPPQVQQQQKRPISTKEIKYNPPKSVFNNKAAFGKTFRLKPGSFN